MLPLEDSPHDGNAPVGLYRQNRMDYSWTPISVHRALRYIIFERQLASTAINRVRWPYSPVSPTRYSPTTPEREEVLQKGQ